LCPKTTAVLRQIALKLDERDAEEDRKIMSWPLVARAVLRGRPVSACRPAAEDDIELVSFNGTNCFSYDAPHYKF
jgi:hypothetical protein